MFDVDKEENRRWRQRSNIDVSSSNQFLINANLFFLQKHALSLLLFIIEVMLELEHAYMYSFFEYEWVTYIKLHTCIIVQHNCSFHFRQMACLLRDVIACQLGINLLLVTSCSTLSLSSEAILTLSSVEETVWLAWESNNAVYEWSCIWTRKRRLNA